MDEVLAVGDAISEEVPGQDDDVLRGRTVLFVSHNMAAVAEMANRALLLDAGSVAVDGSVADAVSTYLSRGARKASYIRPLDPQINFPHIARAEILTSDFNAVQRFGEALEIKFWIRHPVPMKHGSFCFQIRQQSISNPCYPFIILPCQCIRRQTRLLYTPVSFPSDFAQRRTV